MKYFDFNKYLNSNFLFYNSFSKTFCLRKSTNKNEKIFIQNFFPSKKKKSENTVEYEIPDIKNIG